MMVLMARKIPVLAALSLSLALGWSAETDALGKASVVQDQPTIPDPECSPVVSNPKRDLGDGVYWEDSLRITKTLFDSEQNKPVRVVSFHLNFRKELAVLSEADGLLLVDPQGNQPITLSVGGVDPRLVEPKVAPSATPHAYDVYIAPLAGKSWGDVRDKQDFETTIIRTQ